jgi:Zn-dependent M28 family amino/carboxypeptidase
MDPSRWVPTMRLFVIGLLVFTTLAGCTTDSSDDTVVPPAEPQIPDVPVLDAAQLLGELKAFAGTYNERADNLPDHLGARDYLAASFEEAGLEVWRHEFENGIAQENIVGILWGHERDEWVVVGAHYDMTSKVGGGPARERSQGAYDDGSGTMMVVHLAKEFANLPQPKHTIAFVGFDGEERGLQGSGAFAEHVVSGDSPYGNVRFRGMLDLDMFGLNWPGVDAPIYMDDNSPELQAYVEGLRMELGIPDNMIRYQGLTLGRSDYDHFFKLGVPTAFFISSFEEWQLPADLPYTVTGTTFLTAYPFWHLEDTYDTMVLMAGSEADLQAGFQTAVDLASGVLHFLAFTEANLTAV